jgi:hypothetical protein
MRQFMRWMWRPFIRFAFKDTWKQCCSIRVGQMSDNPEEIQLILDNALIGSVIELDIDEAMTVGKALESCAYYAGEGLVAPPMYLEEDE